MSCANTSISSIVSSLGSQNVTNTLPVNVNSSVTATTNAASSITGNTNKSIEQHYEKVLNKQRLQDLIREVDSNVHPDEDVEELLLQLAEEFIEDIVDTSCQFAKHRNVKTLEVKDVQLSLEKHWNMWIPGFGGEEYTVKPYKKSLTTDAHKQRMALLKRAKK